MASAEEEIDGLYGLPLEEFTPARNELAKRLRGEGEKSVAAEVAKLRKPSRPAWAINRAVRDRPELARAVLDAAAGLADAQEAVVSGSGREALDDAVNAEREAVEELVVAARAQLEQAGPGSPAMVDRARKTLHAVAGDPDLQAELEAGRIVTDREPVGFGTALPAAPAKRRREAGKGPKAKSSTGKARTPKRAKSREREERTKEERAARKTLLEARRRVDQSERRFGKRERDVKRAQERLAQARAGLVAAEEEVAELSEDLQRRRKELEDARAVLGELS